MRRINWIYGLLLLFIMVSCSSSKRVSSSNGEEGLSYEEQSRLLTMVLSGEREEMKNNLAKAISYYRECIEIDPNSDVCYFKLATVYYGQGNFSTALSRIQKAIEINPENKWYYLLEARTHLDRKSTRLNSSHPK